MEKAEKQKRKKEKVEVFGKEVQDYHRHDGNDVVFGVIILFAGIVFLLNSLGVIPWNVWEVLQRYWPVILILWGIQIILGRNRLSRFIVLILSFVVIATLIIYVLRGQLPGVLKFIPQKFIEWSNYWEVIKK